MDRALLVQLEFDFRATTPVPGLLALCFFTLDLGENVERGVHLLRRVFVGVGAQLIVVCGLVLPLAQRLHGEQLHECVDFHFGVLALQGLAIQEEAVLGLGARRDFLGRPHSLWIFFTVVLLAVFFVATLFAVFVFVAVVLIFIVVLFFLGLGVEAFDNRCEGGASALDRTLLDLF